MPVEYIEKDLPCPHKQIEAAGMDELNKIGRLPYFLFKRLLRKNLQALRDGMGGDSKDITQRRIISQDRQIPGYRSEVDIRIYTPPGENTRPALVYFHGGGWVGGTIQAVEEFCRGVSDQADCVVISVAYHLAPEYPYPEGLEDCYAAVKWVVLQSENLNIDPGRISVGGDSAGGNYASVLTMLARQRKEFTVDKQILVYAAVLISPKFASSKARMLPPGMAKFVKALYEFYIPQKRLFSNPLVSPMLAEDFTDLPEALITVGDKDFLLKEDKEYAEKLNKGGVKVRMIIYKDTYHAFIDNTGTCLEADDFIGEVARFIG